MYKHPKLTCSINFSTAQLDDVIKDAHAVLICDKCMKVILTKLDELEVIAEGPYGQLLYGTKCDCGNSVPFIIGNCDAYFVPRTIRLT